MKIYQQLLANILTNGVQKGDRTGTGTISAFGQMMRFPLSYDLWPVPTTRKVAYIKAIEELEWFLKGMTHTSWLKERNNHIWDAWAGKDSGIGPMYGEQWRNWTTGIHSLSAEDESGLKSMLDQETTSKDPAGSYNEPDQGVLTAEEAMSVFKKFLAEKTKPYAEGGRGGIDQLQNLLDSLKHNPDDRRMVVSAWNTSVLPYGGLLPHENADAGRMALAPCHAMWQVWTAPLSDREILTKIVETDDHFKGLIEHAFRFLSLEHALNTIEVQGHLATRKYYDGDKLTLEGAQKIQEYKQAGKPVRKLSLMLMARSQDLPLGTVFNVASYSLLAKLLAQVSNMVPHEYIHVLGDAHIYVNQLEGVQELLKRKPLEPTRLILDPTIESIDDFTTNKCMVFYKSHPAIKFPVAV